jgi:hypothetical protein
MRWAIALGTREKLMDLKKLMEFTPIFQDVLRGKLHSLRMSTVWIYRRQDSGGSVMARQQWQLTLKKLLVQVTIWLVTEAVLDFAGLDMLANYSEFISEKMMTAIHSHTVSVDLIAYQD